MALVDILNYAGKRKKLRPAGLILHGFATHFRLSTLVRLAGRRLVTAPSGSAVLSLAGNDFTATLSDPVELYRAMKYGIETLDFDIFVLMVDLSVEAEVLGCELKFHPHNVPDVVSHPVKTLEDAKNLRLPDPMRDGRMPVFLKALELITANYTLLKSATVIGPFTLASHLIGSEIYLDMRKNREKVKATLEHCQRFATIWGRALAQAGADYIAIADPAASQLSPQLYEEFSQPYTTNLIRSLPRPCVLHVCGKAGHLIGKMAQSGAVGLSIDEVDIAKAIDQVPRNVVILGNIGPIRIKLRAAEEIRAETLALLDVVKSRREYIVCAGCDLAPETPKENIISFIEAVRSRPKSISGLSKTESKQNPSPPP